MCKLLQKWKDEITVSLLTSDEYLNIVDSECIKRDPDENQRDLTYSKQAQMHENSVHEVSPEEEFQPDQMEDAYSELTKVNRSKTKKKIKGTTVKSLKQKPKCNSNKESQPKSGKKTSKEKESKLASPIHNVMTLDDSHADTDPQSDHISPDQQNEFRDTVKGTIQKSDQDKQTSQSEASLMNAASIMNSFTPATPLKTSTNLLRGRPPTVAGDHEDGSEVCSICGKYLANIKQLEKHLATHNKVKTHSCELCGKSYTTAHYLQAHIKLHKDAGKFKCSQCEKTFNSKLAVRNHTLRLHGGVKNHLCRFCPRSFWSISIMRDHERTHTNEKPYSCPYCSRPFRETGLLRKHIRTHTNEKPYPCRTCGKYFSTTSNRGEHERNVHTNERFECPKRCGKLFRRNGHANTHGQTCTGPPFPNRAIYSDLSSPLS